MINNSESVVENNVVVSVIMPVYNGEKYLNEAINSILEQTFSDFEFIIINDGSTDSSKSIICSFNDSRIVYLENETCKGIAKSLNLGLKIAKGKYIARMDSDDISLPERIKVQVTAFVENPDLDVVSVLPVHVVDSENQYRSIRFLPLHSEAAAFVNLFELIFCHPCIMVKSEVIKSIGYSEDERFLWIEDYALAIELLLRKCKIQNIDKFLLLYRVNTQGVSFAKRDIQIKNTYKAVQKQIKDNFNVDITNQFFNRFNTKKGWNSVDELKSDMAMLNKFFIEYVQKNPSLTAEGINEIRSWLRIRFVAFWFSLLQNRETKWFGILQICSHSFFIFDKLFRRVFFLWKTDWRNLKTRGYDI